MSAAAGYKLFTPLRLGNDLELKNRIIMSPMTRARSDKVTRGPVEINELYYEQRAGAGLIITEGTGVSEQGFGWHGTPALYTEAHAAAWKNVTDRVHAKGGKIFLQLWHIGRQGHSSFNPKREIVAASAIGLSGGQARNSDGEHVSFEVPRALETSEVADVVNDYRKSAALAKKAGFDGVDIHAANGYLIDTFLQSVSNKRTDKYGGSIENRARFLLEIVDAIKQEWSATRIGVRLAPNGGYADMGSADNFDQFTYIAKQLATRDIGYIALLDGFGFGYHDKGRLVTVSDIKQVFPNAVIATNSYTRDIAEGAVRSGAADAVSFGRLYISNPDLAERFEHDWAINAEPGYDDWWNSTKGAEGYTTFPAYTPKEN